MSAVGGRIGAPGCQGCADRAEIADRLALRVRGLESQLALARVVSYGDMADILGVLPGLVRDTRSARRATLQKVGVATGLSASTVCRVEHEGGDVTLVTVVALLRWLDGADVEEEWFPDEPHWRPVRDATVSGGVL